MKIVAGMGSVDDYLPYADAGADEVFIGYVPRCWQEQYGLTMPLNRREVCYYNVQAGSRSELEILADMMGARGTNVTLAFNALSFRAEQYPVIAEIMWDCLSLGFRDAIIADLGLLVYLQKAGLTEALRIHVSGEFGELNYPVIKELIQLGARRIIFHRKVSLRNMELLIAQYRCDWSSGLFPAEPVEFEAFILNENCHFNGAYCNSLHCDELVPMCRMPYRVNVPLRESRPPEGEFDYDYGLKDLKTLADIGVTHLKIVGRGADSDYMIHCIRGVAELLREKEL